MTKKLFNDFSSVSSKQWKQKIQVDLKGANYNDALIWNTNEGIDVKPFYHADEFKNEFSKESYPNHWYIGQSIFVHDVSRSNEKALDIINRGAESIKFIIPNKDIAINDLLQNIDTNIVLYFELQFLDHDFVQTLFAIKRTAKTYIFTDIINHLARTGNWFTNLNEDHKHFESIVNTTRHFSIDVGLFQNAGANLVQQLAYAMAQTNEYLNYLNADGKPKPLSILYKVAVGTNYFFEIAKIRALRLLVNSLTLEYDLEIDCHILALPTKRNKTIYDYNTNMLRTTTECMSAVLGGANTVCNLSYDAIYHKSNEFGERISRNQLLILKHESYFDAVNNASDGSYYIESLTQQLAEKALDIFKNIEAQGGFLHQLKEGVIQRKIKESAIKEEDQFNDGKMVLLGTNKHPNTQHKMKHELELFPFVKTNIRKTLIQPIIEKRLAETIEQERLKTEN